MISTISTWLWTFVSSRLGERGQDLVEYAVLVGAIGVAAGAVLLVAPLPAAIGDFSDTVVACVTFNQWGGATCD